MRPVTTAALQNSQIWTGSFSEVWVCLLWDKVCHTATKADVTGKGDSIRVWGAGLGVSKLGSSVHAALVSTDGSVLMPRSRGSDTDCFLCSWKVLYMNDAPLGYVLR